MKKLLAIIFSLGLLAGCAADNGTADVSETTASKTETVTSKSTETATTVTSEEFSETTTASETETVTSESTVTTTTVTSEKISETTTTTAQTETTAVTAQTQQDTSSLTSLTAASEVTTAQTTESTTIVQIEYPALTPLTVDESEKLKEDFAEYKSSVWTDVKSDEMFIMNYYGKYNGNEVVVMYSMEYTMTDDEKEVNVGKYTFELPSGSLEILLHADNDFIDIQTAYATGYLNDEDIAAIYYYSTNK